MIKSGVNFGAAATQCVREWSPNDEGDIGTGRGFWQVHLFAQVKSSSTLRTRRAIRNRQTDALPSW
jgi:hypothetical protein